MGFKEKWPLWKQPTKRCICTSQNTFRSFKLERAVPVGQAIAPKSNEEIMEKRQQSIPKKEIECLKGKFVTSEKTLLRNIKLLKKTSALTSGILPEKHFEDNESSDDSVDGGNNVCIDRVESAVIQTSVRINDYELKAVIDTGAEVTVLSEKVYRNLAKEYHLELKTATRGLLVAEEGKKMSATGITEIEMSLGPLRFTWPVYVAPLNDDLLLGCDIIDEMDITVNTKRGIQIKDIWYPCEVKRRENKVLRIVLNKSISIKSQSEMIIQILVPDTEIFKSNFALFEPVIYDNRKILAGKGLVSTQIPFIPVRFINLENSPLKIKEGTLIGTLETVDEVTDFVDVTDVQMTKIPKICRLHDPVKTHDTSENVFTSSRENKVDEFCSEVPEYLKELFQNSCKNIKSNTAKKTLADVLVKHKDAFAKSKTELGSCSVLKHRIDTAHAAPVRQPLRRTPQAFEKEEEKYLRDQIETGVVRPSSSAWSSPVVLVQSISSWKIPENVKEVQQFLGLCNYYRRFILHFSEIASPLTQLTGKNVKFEWTKDCEAAFTQLKNALMSTPVLAYPNPQLPFILDTDASNVGIGAVLSQVQDGQEKAIAFGSKKLNKAQQRYNVTRRELLAVITFVHQFRHFLLGNKFLLRTDHSSLRWLFNFKDPQGQLARWHEVLSQYNFDIQHRAGIKHTNADALSRKDFDSFPVHEDKSDDWTEFHDKVDNIKDIGRTNESIRAVTRSSTKQARKPANWLQKYTASEMKELQRKDNDVGPLFTWKESKEPTTREQVARFSPATRKYWLNWNNIISMDNVLYQRLVPNNPTDVPKMQLLVPEILRSEILTLCHDSIFSAHFGIKKTTMKIKEHFHWYRMREDIKQHIRQCPSCYENKRKWDFYIPILMSAYRSTVHPSTGFSPNKLMLGREVNLPHELLYPLPRHNAQKPVNEYVDDLRVHMEDIYHVARENLKQSGEKQKRDHDTRIIDKPFLVGSLMEDENDQATFNCRKCGDEMKSLKEAIWHVQFNHTTYNHCPYFCTICHFKCNSLNRLENHVTKYKLHAKLAADVQDSQDNTFLKKNTAPYNVTWGNQGTEDLAINYPGIVIDVQEEVVEIITNTETPIKTTDAETQTDTKCNMEDFEKQLKDQRKEVLKLREEATFWKAKVLAMKRQPEEDITKPSPQKKRRLGKENRKIKSVVFFPYKSPVDKLYK
ncbi:unnamed protein product [Mytilus edulis]|uniref:Peptidase A2 domain-containing protein n=1 Tax=Mytilus edulis TaxID=6550 RepID=A0A8S3UTI7_MYTED|nr:unnamed protein product [Mytilus edulis]